MQLAIEAYKNQQKIYMQNHEPVAWAEIQEKIGNIFYLLGKLNDDDKLMGEARNYFNSALEVYNDLNLKSAVKNVSRSILKIRNYIG